MACTCKPGKPLCNSCLTDTFERNKLNLAINGTTVYQNADGEYTLNQVDEFEKKFKSNIVVDVQNNPLSGAVKRYGEKEFYDAASSINNDFLKRDYIKAELANNAETYPVLNERLTRGAITPLEFAAFIRDSNYTPAAAIASSNAAGSRFLEELEEFYNGDFSASVLGGFCAMFNSVFGAIGGFFDLIDGVSSLIGDALSFLDKIKNIEDPLQALFDKIKVKALIEAVKEKITSTIEKTIKKVKKMVENFNPSEIIGDIKDKVQKAIAEKVNNIQNAVSSFFSQENIDKILGKVNGLIDYAVGQFSNPSVEEISFMISRFCALATGVEGLIKGIKAPLDDFSNRYDEVFNTLSNASNRITGEAIRAGAIRFSDEKRTSEINKQKEVWGNIKRGETPLNPAAEKLFEIGPPTSNELANIPTWEDIREGKDGRIFSTTSSMFGATKEKGSFGAGGPDGWNNLTLDTRIGILRLHSALKNHINGKIEIITGWIDGNEAEFFNKAHESGTYVKLKWEPWGHDEISIYYALEYGKMMGWRRIVFSDSWATFDMGGNEFYKNNMSRNIPPVTSPTKITGRSEVANNIDRNAARAIVMETKGELVFEENGHTYKAVYRPPTRSNYTEGGVETTFGGTVTITLVK